MNVCMLLYLLLYIYLHWYLHCTNSVPDTTNIQMRLPLFIGMPYLPTGSKGTSNAVGLYFGVIWFQSG